mgnify:CR=1 FL=1
MKRSTFSGCIPVKVSVSILPIVTAGFANEVEEVNQYAAVIYNPTAGAINSDLSVLTLKITNNKPKVAIISDTYKLIPDLEFEES